MIVSFGGRIWAKVQCSGLSFYAAPTAEAEEITANLRVFSNSREFTRIRVSDSGLLTPDSRLRPNALKAEVGDMRCFGFLLIKLEIQISKPKETRMFEI